jgi:autotransporter-associated beta strand protein
LTLSGASTYAGGTVIDAGTLVAGNSSALSNGPVQINNGSRLSLASVDPTVGAVTVTNGSISGNGTLSAASFTVQTGSASANLSSGGPLAKTGSGNFILNGNGSFIDDVIITGGALVVNGNITLGKVVASGPTAVLAGNGTIPDALVYNTAKISPGYDNLISGNLVSAFSTLTIEGNLSWNGTGTINPWHLNTGNLAVTGFAGNTSDSVNILGALSNNGTIGSIIFDFQNTGFYDSASVANSTYTLMTASNTFASAGFQLSQFSAVNVGAGGLDTASSYFIFGNGGTSLQYVVVPEPSVGAAAMGGVVLLCGLFRRKFGRRR